MLIPAGRRSPYGNAETPGEAAQIRHRRRSRQAPSCVSLRRRATPPLRALALAALLLAPVPAAAEPREAPPPAAAGCERIVHDDQGYVVCTADAARDRLDLFDRDDAGLPLATFGRLASLLASKHRSLVFAVNAGMYHLDLSPVGLFVADGAMRHPAVTGSGSGNFFLKPNGVFFAGEGRAGILETAAFLSAGLHPDVATQSGPMLVIAGRLHPALKPDGTSLKKRNGVGVRDGHVVVFALSDAPVSFHRFALLFRDRLGCPDALYLDGTVSAVDAPALPLDSQVWPLGPMLAVTVPATPRP